MHYLRGKADWMIRGLPCEPRPTMREKIRALPYFINNLAPGLRANWITLSRRATVMQFTVDDVPRIGPRDSMPIYIGSADVIAVVLNADGILLGALDSEAKGGRENILDAMNPAPQTIRPDMTHRLAAKLLESHRYILSTTAMGKYLGRYHPPPLI
jgi:hypothetical protein